MYPNGSSRKRRPRRGEGGCCSRAIFLLLSAAAALAAAAAFVTWSNAYAQDAQPGTAGLAMRSGFVEGSEAAAAVQPFPLEKPLPPPRENAVAPAPQTQHAPEPPLVGRSRGLAPLAAGPVHVKGTVGRRGAAGNEGSAGLESLASARDASLVPAILATAARPGGDGGGLGVGVDSSGGSGSGPRVNQAGVPAVAALAPAAPVSSSSSSSSSAATAASAALPAATPERAAVDAQPIAGSVADDGRGPFGSEWRPVSLTAADWVVYVRIQKTGSQTFWQTLQQTFDGGVWGRRGQVPKMR